MNYNLKRILLLPLFWKCNWHRGFEPENWNDYPPSCPECGCLLSTDICSRCGKDFLHFGSSFDDIMGDASVTSGGDLMCTRCAARYEREEEEEAEAEYLYDYDPYLDEPPPPYDLDQTIARGL